MCSSKSLSLNQSTKRMISRRLVIRTQTLDNCSRFSEHLWLRCPHEFYPDLSRPVHCLVDNSMIRTDLGNKADDISHGFIRNHPGLWTSSASQWSLDASLQAYCMYPSTCQGPFTQVGQCIRTGECNALSISYSPCFRTPKITWSWSFILLSENVCTRGGVKPRTQFWVFCRTKY